MKITRDEEKRALEALLVAFRPDGVEAEELMVSIKAGLMARYEDCGADAYQAIEDACEACVELYDTHGEDPLNPFDQGPDPMDLARNRRQAEEAI